MVDDDLLTRAVDDERDLNARRLVLLRMISVMPLLAFQLLMLSARVPDAPASVAIYSVYFVFSVGYFFAARRSPRILRYAWWLIALWDTPILYLQSYLAVVNSPSPLMTSAMGLSLWMILFTIVQFSMRARVILALTVIASVLQGLLFARAGVAFMAIISTVVIAITGLVTSYAASRRLSLVKRVVEESQARLAEVQLLNDELRRQVGDRARQLAEALARVEAPPAAAAEPGTNDSLMRAIAHAPPRAPAPRLSPGDLVEQRYRVIASLGRGGMGEVHEVERVADRKRFALKVISGASDRSALVRLAREAQLAAEVAHPHVVSVIDVDVAADGLLYVVMELVPGKSLAAARDRYGNIAWAKPILAQIASALAAMHARGIVHRDLKPANVLVDGDRVKVADFGIARLAPAAVDMFGATGLQATRTGAIVGTPAYIAPELVGGAAATSAADMFSFGVLAYELLAGKPPHELPPVLELLAGRKLAPPAKLTGVTGDVAAVVDACLAVDPGARPTAAEVAQAWLD